MGNTDPERTAPDGNAWLPCSPLNDHTTRNFVIHSTAFALLLFVVGSGQE